MEFMIFLGATSFSLIYITIYNKKEYKRKKSMINEEKNEEYKKMRRY